MRHPELRLTRLAWATFGAFLFAGGVHAQEAGLEQRLERVERVMSSQGLVDMQLRLETLQREVQNLRGQLEETGHLLEEIRQRQRDLYLDLDRRLLQVERTGNASPQGDASPAPAAAPAGDMPAAASAPTPAVAQGAATPPADPAAEQQAYEKAFELLRELRYEPAIAAFREFLGAYPRGRYAHVAQYWLGEANYAQRRFDQAIADYQALLDNHPQSPKRAEATLKIGYSHFELGQVDQARDVLQRLTREFPRTTEAGQAENLLQRMRLQSSS